MIAWLALSTLIALPSGTALERSRAALAEAEFETALTYAETAETEAGDARDLAQVYRQQGLVREVLGRADHAVVAFARALRCDPTITLDKRTTKRSTIELFGLARALTEAGTDVLRVRKSLEPRVGRDATMCGSPSDAQPLTARGPEPAAGPSWTVWTLGGVALASGAAAGVLGALAVSRNNECRTAATPAIYSACDSQASSLELGANISFTAAGVAAGAAVLWWWLED